MPNKTADIVDAAITSRRSIRAFRPDPVPLELVSHILEAAARAPSGTNMQPWRVHVLSGASRDRIVNAVCHAFDHESDQHKSEYLYYPAEFFEPYLGRRRKLGIALYSLLGIGKADKEAMRLQQRQNFEFFGAPIGLLFTIHRELAIGSWLDYGMFLQNIMIAARGHGLDTCPQAAWSRFHRVIRAELAFAPEEMLICGMALGYADTAAKVNELRAERMPLGDFVTFHD